MSLFWVSNAWPSVLISVLCCVMDAAFVSRRVERFVIEDVVLECDVSMARRRDVVSLSVAVIAVLWATEVASLVGRLDVG